MNLITQTTMIQTMFQMLEEVTLSLMRTQNSIQLQKTICYLCEIPFYLQQPKPLILELLWKTQPETTLRNGTPTLQGRERAHLIIWRRASQALQRKAESNTFLTQSKYALPQSLEVVECITKETTVSIASSLLALHLEAVHGSVEEVARAVLYPKNSKERCNALNILRRRGNFAYNAHVVSKESGELQDSMPRRLCGSTWKSVQHEKKPMMNPGLGSSEFDPNVPSKTAVVQEISEGLKSVISCMSYDEVTRTIQNDKLLLQFQLFDLNGSRKNRHDLIKQRLRELGRLLVVAQKKTLLYGKLRNSSVFPTSTVWYLQWKSWLGTTQRTTHSAHHP